VNPLAAASQALRFLVAELGALAALVVWALDAFDGVVAVLVAIAAPLVVVALWAVWVAPKAARRLPDPWRFVLELAIFAAATLALVASGHGVLGIVYAAIAVVSAALVRVWPEP
jgi:Protein of unknown function (DUF2568)